MIGHSLRSELATRLALPAGTHVAQARLGRVRVRVRVRVRGRGRGRVTYPP